jgi:ABC-type Fe3+-hydroxamate transport system substrate-binding protein
MRVEGEGRRMDDQLYERKRNGLKDQLESLNKRLQNTTSSESRTEISNKIADLEGKLAGLADAAENHGAGGATSGATPGAAGGQSDAGSAAVMRYVADLLGGKRPAAADKGKGGAAAPSIRQLKPLDPDAIDSYIAKAGGDPAEAKRLARQDGYAVP